MNERFFLLMEGATKGPTMEDIEKARRIVEQADVQWAMAVLSEAARCLNSIPLRSV